MLQASDECGWHVVIFIIIVYRIRFIFVKAVKNVIWFGSTKIVGQFISATITSLPKTGGHSADSAVFIITPSFAH